MTRAPLISTRLTLILLAAIAALSSPSLAQVRGDFRSKASGNWNSISTWQTYSDTSWIDASSYPSGGTNTTTILAGHNVALIADEVAGPLIVQGRLSISSLTALTSGGDLTVNGTVSGLDSTSLMVLQGSYNVYLNNATFSTVTLTVRNENTRLFQGSATFSGSKIIVDWSGIELSDNLSLTSAAIDLTTGQLDLLGNQFTLAACTLIVGPNGSVFDNGEVKGVVVTNGSTSIDMGGSFSADLQVHSGTTTAWSETAPPAKLLPGPGKGTYPVQSLTKMPRTLKSGAQNSTTSSDFAQFTGNVEVESGATLRVPSDNTLSVGSPWDGSPYLTVAGTITGVDATSRFEVDGYDYNLVFNEGTVSIANFDIIAVEGGQYIEGSATFTGSTFNITRWTGLELSDDFSITGGTMTLVFRSLLDTYGNKLTLNGTTLNIGRDGVVDNYSEVMGEVDTRGTTTIDQGGEFYVPLQVLSGTTSAWCESYPPSNLMPGPVGNEVPSAAKNSKIYATRSTKGRARITTADALTVFEADIDVYTGATLLIPSGKTLEMDESIYLDEDAGSTTIGRVQGTWYYDTTGVSFGGLGLWIHSNGSNPGYITVARTTGTAPTVSGATAIKRYFDITPTNNSGLTADFTFWYTTGELNGASESGLSLYKSTNGGESWTKQAGAVNTSGHSITLYGVDSFSRWTAAAERAVPRLLSISPTSAVRDTTLEVRLNGTNFGTSASVSFSGTGISVNDITVNSATLITARITVAPSAALGAHDVYVVAPSGTSTLSAGFLVLARNPVPALTSVNPSSAILGESVAVTLIGSGFASGLTTVSFGGGITVRSLSVTNDHTLVANISVNSDATTGPRDVVVSNPAPGGGTATMAAAFSVWEAPRLTAVSPNLATRGQVLSVVLTGANFVAGVTSVNFGNDIAVDSTTVLGSTQLRARLSISSTAATGTRDVSITNSGPGGGTATLTGGFTVSNPAAAITAVTPLGGSRGTSANVTITGSGFIQGATTVGIGGAGITINSIVVRNATSMAATFLVSRDATPGPRDVTVSNPAPGGGSTTLAGAFTIQNPLPVLTSVSPNTGVLGQTLTVTVTGSGFLIGVSSADFGSGITINSASVDTSGTHVTAGVTIAAGAAPGDRALTVTNSAPGGGSATLSRAFTVTNPAPTLTSVAPAAGGKGETLDVTMVGSNFINGTTSVSFGPGVTVNSAVVKSPTSLTANITIAMDAVSAARSVVVTNAPPGGGSATLSFVFNVQNAAPTVASISPGSGTRGQTMNVVLAGTGFTSGASTVSLGPGITINSTTVNSLTQMTLGISIASDAAMGPRDVAVTNPVPGGGSATLPGAFTVANPAPTIASISPVSAGRGSLLKITVVGTQFIDAVTTLNFGADISITNFTIKSSSEIQVNVSINPAASIGTRTVTVTNAAPGGGSASLTNAFSISSAPATSVEGELGVIPDTYVLQEAYPNPFNPSTRIRYGVPENSRVRIDVHNMLGNVVTELVNGDRSKGMYELQWHADNLPSGVYLIRFNAESSESDKRFIASRKVVLVK